MRKNSSAACWLVIAPVRTAGTCCKASPSSRTNDSTCTGSDRASDCNANCGSVPIGSGPINPSR